jgi:hypothetical protein
VGSALQFTLDAKAKSERGDRRPRLFVYPMLGRPPHPEAAVNRVEETPGPAAARWPRHEDRRRLAQHLRRRRPGKPEAAGLPIAIHIGVEETNATDAIRQPGRHHRTLVWRPRRRPTRRRPKLPRDYNYLNEADRFRYAGRLWREADPQKLGAVLDAMVAQGVAWDRTLEIYEASRDLQRANQPWFRDYLHPALGSFFTPNLENHGSYFINWSSTDEAFWKENYPALVRRRPRLRGPRRHPHHGRSTRGYI